MCGILGIVSSDSRLDRAAFLSSLALLAHRGPDGEGVWNRPGQRSPFVTLGHRRLAIIDLSEAAAQPMRSADSRLWVTYNGELYNYRELMKELEAKGHVFRSASDTEVVLTAYREWGPACLQRFNGMFAFAVWDERKQELFAARDRFGEKPFHYVWDQREGFFAFASEIKALLALPRIDKSLNEQSLYRFVAFQELAASDQTLWRGIRRLPHAHWLRVSWRDDGPQLTLGRYWDIDLSQTLDVSLEEAARRFNELFVDSVRLRLRSDVPLGTSLSGGLDSSAVVCQIHALGALGGQKTFSARMEDPALDEGRHIATVLAKTNVENYEIWPSAAELVRIFPSLCYHLEEPFLATSQFAQHLVMRLASEHRVTVLLDGQGGDELLAGYVPYFAARYAGLAEEWRLADLWREWRGCRAIHPGRFPLSAKALGARLFPRTYTLFRQLGDGAPATSRVRWGEMASWWKPDWLDEFKDQAPPAPPAAGRDRLTRKLYSDAMGGELQELLRYGDRNSMAWSRELRQPFLDHRLAELLFALPPHYKLHRGETKALMRVALPGLVPDSILRRQDKLGYQAPLSSWLCGPLSKWTEERLEEASAELKGLLVADVPARFGRARRSLDESSARAVFSILTLAESSRQLAQIGSGQLRSALVLT